MANDPRIFFQVAAALIPALIFGGLVTDRFRPPNRWSKHQGWWEVATVAVVGFALMAFLAELTAIEVAFSSGDPAWFQIVIVASVLVLGTVATVVALCAPWVTRAASYSDIRPGRKQIWFGVLAAVIMVVLSVATITKAVQGEQDLKSLHDQLVASSKADSFAQFYAAVDSDVRARAADGLIPRKLEREFHVCVADRAYEASFQALFIAATNGKNRIPSDQLKNLVPFGVPMKCPFLLPPVLPPP